MPTEAEAIAEAAEGPAFIGIFINVMLYGAMLTQTFFYYSTYKTDPRWMKIYVCVLFLADTVNTIFNCAWIYGVLINNFGNEEALGVGNWLFQTDQAMTGIISMQVQFFYAWRINRLTGNKLLVASVLIPSVVGGLSGIGTAIGVGILPQLAGLQRLTVVVSLWLAGSAIADVTIACVLTWHLKKQRTGFQFTDTMVTRMIQLIMSNGALTAVFAVSDLIAYLASTKGYHLIFNYSLAKLYGNSAMSSLNARALLKNANSTPSGQAEAHRMTGGRTPDIGSFVKSSAARPTQIVVNVETHELADVNGQDAKLRMEWQDRSTVSDAKGDMDVAV
ncbi:uncharacterized protein C8Q71DRAFT_890783 [Rhodofomes roseus]|uniref:DUF6534 domain-containing protein n=1 Tax=Rhodofomes roseus TaxID=34475 RepID=A0ABQ8KRB8_9APHY|nr:uncharacterized protein C8Q71DRAFT_890783 [Rhodofomes roseus]KAH9841080.1 hypothetical protein C8Q71DRAFT_890783 [Rhodofomes roseus]